MSMGMTPEEGAIGSAGQRGGWLSSVLRKARRGEI